MHDTIEQPGCGTLKEGITFSRSPHTENSLTSRQESFYHLIYSCNIVLQITVHGNTAVRAAIFCKSHPGEQSVLFSNILRKINSDATPIVFM